MPAQDAKPGKEKEKKADKEASDTKEKKIAPEPVEKDKKKTWY